MGRKLNREELFESNPLIVGRTPSQHAFTWFVHDEYVLVEQGDGEDPYFEATSVPRSDDELKEALNHPTSGVDEESPFGMGQVGTFGRLYEPLIDTPYLFLDFARLFEQKDPEQALIRWILQYGLLGLCTRNPSKFEISLSGYPLGFAFDKEYSQRGGQQETLARVSNEARQANQVLTCYEAVLARDVEKLEQVASEDFAQIPWVAHYLYVHPQQYDESTGWAYIDALIDWILVVRVLTKVQEVLKAYTFPAIAHRSSLVSHTSVDDPWAPDLVIRSFYPRNLLGAMYLQFYWLVTSAAELERCRHCGKLIPHDIPMPGSGKKRKTHKNKKYCDERCRQNYHYHNVTKPRRNAERNGGNA